MNADGTGLADLTNDPAPEFDPAWSPTGAKVAFARTQSSGTADIYVMNASGSAQTRLTTNPLGDEEPAWSPDGGKIAFSRNTSGQCRFSRCGEDLYVMNSDGSGVTALTQSSAIDTEPAWSPDGSKIAFTRINLASCTPDCDAEIYTMSPNGTNQVDVTNNPAYDFNPSWAPDGSKVAFASNRSACCSAYEIYTMNANGSSPTKLTSSTGTYLVAGQPAWSPDGSKITFAWDPAGYCDGTCGDEIFFMNGNGSGATRITNDTARDDGPDWQPIVPYARPLGASPLEVVFVPAFTKCETTSSDSRHGGPLNFQSCSNPTPTSSTARVGTNTLSIARMVVCPANSTSQICNPTGGSMPKPDLRFTGSIRDIHCQAAIPAGCTPGGDYNPNGAAGPYTDAGNGKGGAQPPCFPSATSDTTCLAGADLTEVAELSGASPGGVGTEFAGRGVRITDSDNGSSGTDGATVIDIGFPVPLDCLPTTDTTQGSTCGVNTTATALAPGVVKNGDAAIWQIGQVELKDSGPDGVRGNSDDELFATQGVFLP